MADNEEAAWAKININQTVDDLLKYGPSIKIGIAPVPFTGEGMMTVCAQIDTGADGTGMSPRLTSKLNLRPVDTGTIHEAGREAITASFFKVRLFIPPSAEIDTDIAGLPSLNPPHDVLIGRDILSSCRLLIDFTRGVTGLHFKTS